MKKGASATSFAPAIVTGRPQLIPKTTPAAMGKTHPPGSISTLAAT